MFCNNTNLQCWFCFYGIVLNWLLNDFLFSEMFIHHEIIRINCWIFFFFFTIHKIIPQLFFNESIVKVFIIGNLWLLKDVTYIQLHCTCKVDLFKLIIEMISLCLTQNTKGLSGPFFLIRQNLSCFWSVCLLAMHL